MAFYRSSLLVRKSISPILRANAPFIPVLFQLSLASIRFGIFLMCLSIVRKLVVFDFISCVFVQKLLLYNKDE